MFLLILQVFLLTVGDMFPASTGPYLGLYYVLCMGLLGINILMNVLVLSLHYMPCDSLKKDPNETVNLIVLNLLFSKTH